MGSSALLRKTYVFKQTIVCTSLQAIVFKFLLKLNVFSPLI